MFSPTPARRGWNPCHSRSGSGLAVFCVAETTRALRVLETHHAPTYYLPPEDIHAALRPASGSSFCEWKGVARYFDVIVGWQDCTPRRLGL